MPDHRSDARDRLSRTLAFLMATVLAASCGSSITPSGTLPRSAPAGSIAASSEPPPSTPVTESATPRASGQTPESIPQPSPPAGITLAPDSARVDLRVPSFSNPTKITNQLFPISSQASVLMLGHVDDERFRTEVTLLPYTRTIEWNGQAVETAVSQYVAYLGGEIQEVAYDHYAQAEDGSVWYFG